MRLIRYLLLFFVFMVGLFMLLFLSCEHKELCYEHVHTVNTDVVFDWRNQPEARPTSMRLYLFPLDGKKVLLYEFSDFRGGSVSIPIGHYKALCLNNDTKFIRYRNIDRYADFEACTSEGDFEENFAGVPRAKGTEEERFSRSIDRFWTARMDTVCVDLQEKNKVLTFLMEESICSYHITIRHVDNLKYISADGLSGSLSGMSGGLLVGENIPTGELTTIPFGVVHGDSASLKAEFLCFGHCPSVCRSHKVTIYADGNKYYYTYDVTSQIHKASDSRNVHIVIDSLHLPKPIVNGGGFQPLVEKWKCIEIDVPM